MSRRGDQLAKTHAKSMYCLADKDLEPLAAVEKRNPRSPKGPPMKLYEPCPSPEHVSPIRVVGGPLQLEALAHRKWGGPSGLAAEQRRREARRAARGATAAAAAAAAAAVGAEPGGAVPTTADAASGGGGGGGGPTTFAWLGLPALVTERIRNVRHLPPPAGLPPPLEASPRPSSLWLGGAAAATAGGDAAARSAAPAAARSAAPLWPPAVPALRRGGRGGAAGRDLGSARGGAADAAVAAAAGSAAEGARVEQAAGAVGAVGAVGVVEMVDLVSEGGDSGEDEEEGVQRGPRASGAGTGADATGANSRADLDLDLDGDADSDVLVLSSDADDGDDDNAGGNGGCGAVGAASAGPPRSQPQPQQQPVAAQAFSHPPQQDPAAAGPSRSSGPGGTHVLYWMKTAVRGHENPALDAARAAAQGLGLPLVVAAFVTARGGGPGWEECYANHRRFKFWLEGLRDTQRELRDQGLDLLIHIDGLTAAAAPSYNGGTLTSYGAQPAAQCPDCGGGGGGGDGGGGSGGCGCGDGWEALVAAARGAALVVTEDMPVNPDAAWLEELLRRLEQRPGDGCGGCGRRGADTGGGGASSSRAAAAAVGGYGDAHVPGVWVVDTACVVPVRLVPRAYERAYAYRSATEGQYRTPPSSAPAAATTTTAAAAAASDPAAAAPAASGPVAMEVDVDGRGAGAPYPQLESLAVLPQWAQQTLAAHAADPRSRRTEQQLEAGETGDELWDAAQRQLAAHGELHNNLRMTWGKALLGWCDSAQAALQATVRLNHRYALDGCDPASYGGILWCFGLFDGPKESSATAVSGTLRRRPTAAHARRLSPAALAELPP
ncbi:Deoxyribodipyrimidine photo-lyase [Tetrabaena socialis]|uniref:Deoxyribodipyrimidine photo-lyase n=1 Tax=Tetrabaena socialis TaxID=47790 RepID=A0A2J7ZR92_9CHLO|nr:Deoxyribodipyrimidine photo-lyase [Tetrabaena socialis]|eukprot:PNH02789.1 Deoxyribodipyrimidine photo-lyase [Tetrabaena socialis]